MEATKQVIEHLKVNLDRPISVDELADVACLSKIQLYRVFKAAMGMTPVQYHELLRIQKGIELLQSDALVRHVAYDLGYENYETFSRAFKKIVELSPSDMQQIYFRFAERMDHIDYAMLAKEQATILQINDMFQASFSNESKELEVEVYRLSFKTKKKWALIRDTRAEEALLRMRG